MQHGHVVDQKNSQQRDEPIYKHRPPTFDRPLFGDDIKCTLIDAGFKHHIYHEDVWRHNEQQSRVRDRVATARENLFSKDSDLLDELCPMALLYYVSH